MLFINYDGNGGFFDHMVPPSPPQFSTQGVSTVDTVNEIFPGDNVHPAAAACGGGRSQLDVEFRATERNARDVTGHG